MQLKMTPLALAVFIAGMAAVLQAQDRGLNSQEKKELQAVYDSKKLKARVGTTEIMLACKKAGKPIRGPVVDAMAVLTREEEELLAAVTARYLDKVGLVTYSFVALNEEQFGKKIKILPISSYDCGQ